METKRKAAGGHVICAYVFSQENDVKYLGTYKIKQKNPGWKTRRFEFENQLLERILNLGMALLFFQARG